MQMGPAVMGLLAMVALAVMPGAGASQESYADSVALVRSGRAYMSSLVEECPPNEARMRDILAPPMSNYQRTWWPGQLRRFMAVDCFSPSAVLWLQRVIEESIVSGGEWRTAPSVATLNLSRGDHEPFMLRLVSDPAIPLAERIALADAFIGAGDGRGQSLYFRLLEEDSVAILPGPGGPPYGPIRNPLREFLALRAWDLARLAPGPFVPRMMESPLRNQYMGSMLMGLGPSTAEGAAAARSQVERVLTEEIMDLRARASRGDTSVALGLRGREEWIARLRDRR
jgi:hypothetical protein